MADNDAPGAWPIWIPGSRLAGIIKRLTKHCFTQNIKALGPMVLEVYNPKGATSCHGNQSSDPI